MTQLIPPLIESISLNRPGLPQVLAQASTDTNSTQTSSGPLDAITGGFGVGLGQFLPNLLGALAALVIGIVIAYIAAFVVRSLLNKTQIDDKIAANITGRPASDVPAAKWVSNIVFWIIAILAIAATLARFVAGAS